MDIAICVATYKRPKGLKKLLDSIEKMKCNSGEIYVFIADNDPLAYEGKKTVDTQEKSWSFVVECEIEPESGISFARNKALQMVKDSKIDFDYIAFTDDDIEVSHQWIDDLIRTAKLYNADIVCGRNEHLFESQPSVEILTSPFYENHLNGGTGTPIITGGSGNIIFIKGIFDFFGYSPFNHDLAKIGGEDVEFITRVLQHNYKAVQCVSAITYEMFPKERLTLDWVKKRYIRCGGSYCYILLNTMPRSKACKVIIKKTILYPFRILKTKLKPTIHNQCELLHEKAFFKALVKKEYFEEYGRQIV